MDVEGGAKKHPRKMDKQKKHEYFGYCMKCKIKQEMENGKESMENGRRVAKGTCPKCHTKMFAFLPKK